MLCGIWTTMEIQEALKQNYKLLNTFEIHHFPKKSKELFKKYVNPFFALKQKAKNEKNL